MSTTVVSTALTAAAPLSGDLTFRFRGGEAWANLKNGLGDLCATDVDKPAVIVKSRLKSIQYRPALIDGFLAQTGLILEPELP